MTTAATMLFYFAVFSSVLAGLNNYDGNVEGFRFYLTLAVVFGCADRICDVVKGRK